MELTISKALISLGFDSGWVVTEHGIVLWEHDVPQPSEDELVAAGWIKPVGEPS